MTSKKENPYLKQVSGTHYMYMEIQPAEFINKNKLLFAEGVSYKVHMQTLEERRSRRHR